jgi:hypothetical protein
MQKKYYIYFLLFFLSFSLACQTAKYSTSNLKSSLERPNILLLPIDILLKEMSVGGVIEPKAQWTLKGGGNLKDALKDYFNKKNIDLIQYKNKKDAPEGQTQLLKLLTVVGRSIQQHYYFPPNTLPTKKIFKWSVGKEAKSIKDEFKADYALFIYMRDIFTSAGRVALATIMAILGVAIPTGYQEGLTYLVNLETGEVVWFNFLQSAGFGDVRELSGAKTSVESLLTEFPK